MRLWWLFIIKYYPGSYLKFAKDKKYSRSEANKFDRIKPNDWYGPQMRKHSLKDSWKLQ